MFWVVEPLEICGRFTLIIVDVYDILDNVQRVPSCTPDIITSPIPTMFVEGVHASQEAELGRRYM